MSHLLCEAACNQCASTHLSDQEILFWFYVCRVLWTLGCHSKTCTGLGKDDAGFIKTIEGCDGTDGFDHKGCS